MLPDSNKWYVEPVRRTLLLQLELRRVVYSGHTAFQAVDIIETEPFGRTLVLDGKTQSSEADEAIYHEALVHPAMLSHPDPRRVLIAGGGEGATLREVLGYRSVERAVMVDLDRELVELCRQHLPQWHQGAFTDPRSELVFADAAYHLEQHPSLFDVIIVDITDPIEGSPSLGLFSMEFYELALSRLTPHGVLAVQAGPASHGLTGAYTAISKTIEVAAGNVRPYRVEVPSYGGVWGFALAGKAPLPALTPHDVDDRIAKRVTRELKAYDGEAHLEMFSLPKWLRRELAAQQPIATEDRPVVVD
ncbi:MAG: polyamine aminopropyltransferase [Chloroflexi bacterium]|nr:polyamine aminopropyltransferase [Chloroflexota bacterium]